MKLSMVIVATAICSYSTLVRADDYNTPYVQLDSKIYVGAYCRISEGHTQNLLEETLKAAGEYIPGSSMLPEAVTSTISRMALKAVPYGLGDVYCFWMSVNHAKKDLGIPGFPRDRFSRRHLFRSQESELVRTSSNYILRAYGSDEKQISQKTGTCTEHSRCWTNVLKANKDTAGVGMCLQLYLPNSQKKTASLTIGFGSAPTRGAKAAPETCAARTAQF